MAQQRRAPSKSCARIRFRSTSACYQNKEARWILARAATRLRPLSSTLLSGQNHLFIPARHVARVHVLNAFRPSLQLEESNRCRGGRSSLTFMPNTYMWGCAPARAIRSCPQNLVLFIPANIFAARMSARFCSTSLEATISQGFLPFRNIRFTARYQKVGARPLLHNRERHRLIVFDPKQFSRSAM